MVTVGGHLLVCGGGKRDWAYCQLCIQTPYSYTRLTAHNATDLLWEQVSNADNSIIDSWVLHQEQHGPFRNISAATGFSYFFDGAEPPRYSVFNSSSRAVTGGGAYGNATSFPGLPAGLAAALPHYEDGKSVYFFKGSQYWKYDLAAAAVEAGYPKAYGGSTKLFPGVPADLDAALSHPSDGKSVYFFKGSQYWKYDMSTTAVVGGYPKTYGNGTSLWPGVPHGVDAAVAHWSDGVSVFFFKGSQVWMYDVAASKLYDGYPKAYGAGTGNFEGVPSGLAAAFNRCGVDGPPQFGASCEIQN